MVLGLRESVLGQRVERVRVFCDRLKGQTSLAALRKVQGGRVIGLSRKGKFLLFHLSNGSMLVFHLRMTGKLLLVPSANPRTKRDRLRLDFSDWDWALTFEDTRRFGSLDVLHGWESGSGLLKELGPDALIIDLARLPGVARRQPPPDQGAPARPAGDRRARQHLRRRIPPPRGNPPADAGRGNRPGPGAAPAHGNA